MAEINGVDSSSACDQTALDCLVGKGYQFVGRYYSRTTKIAGKKLTQSEAQLISQAGLSIVAVYEDLPTNVSYFSAQRGSADGAGAIQQAQAVGQPPMTPIYFTVDYDAQPSDISGNILAYFQGLATALQGQYAVGVYGSGATCAAMLQSGFATIAWLAQSTGWSGFSSFTDWAIKQGAEQSVCGLNSDLDVAQGVYGGFMVG